MEELGFKVDALAFQLDVRKTQHESTIKELQEEIARLKARLRENFNRLSQPRKWTPADSAFVRCVEWTIPRASQEVLTKPQNEPIYSSTFHVMGVEMKLEFFPQGRESTWIPGFCALFLWCSGGVKLTYQLRVGSHTSAPDTDEYPSHMGHGHSNFCHLASQVDKKKDQVVIGVQILDFCVVEDLGDGLRAINCGPESLVRRKVSLLNNRDMNRVEWRIRNILQRLREVPRGSSICSPSFSLAGVPDMWLELYPNGIHLAEGEAEDPEKAGFCGFYLRCPPGCSLTVALFVGGAKKGPIKADFSSAAAKGLPTFCKLEDQVPEGEDDLICGVSVENQHLQNPEQEIVLESLGAAGQP